MTGKQSDRELIEAARLDAALSSEGSSTTEVHEDDTAPLLTTGAIPGYRLLSERHVGGQGVVYEALQESTQRRVAIKVLREGPLASASERARFEREVAVLAALSHPNIVTVHASGRAAGALYFVMDYIEGDALDVFMQRAEPSLAATLRIFATLASAVEEAHVRGILHRDIKPSNVIVDHFGAPHVLDFGLAKPALEFADGGASENDLTVTGQFVGSLPWASPEQTGRAHEGLDLRSDVYSLGVLLYQMLTGSLPYEVVGDVADVIANIREAQPRPPSKMRGEVDEELETIVLKCLQKERTRRYQNAGELVRDVRSYLAGEAILAKRDSTWYVLRKSLGRHRAVVAFAGALLVVVLGSLIMALVLLRDVSEQHDLAQTARREVARSNYFKSMLLAQHALEEANVGRTQHLLSAAPSELRGWEWDHLTWRSDRSALVLRGASDTILCAEFTPDGERVVSASADGSMRVQHAQSGYQFAEVNSQRGSLGAIALRPAGDLVAVGGENGGLELRSLDDLGLVSTLVEEGPAINALAFDLGGERIACGDDAGGLRVFSRQGDLLNELSTRAKAVHCVTFHPVSGDVVCGRLGGEIEEWKLADSSRARSFQAHGSRVRSLAFRSDGARLISGGTDGHARVWSWASGELLLDLEGHGSWVYAVDWSPYGETLLTSGADHSAKLWDAESGTLLKTLRGHSDRVFCASFDLEGERVVTGSRDRTVRLWEAEGIDDARVFEGHDEQIWSVAFAPDGARVASASSDGTVRVWHAGDERVAPVILAHGDELVTSLAWSADGLQLASGTSAGVLRLFDPTSGSLLRELTAHASMIHWIGFAADGRIATCAHDKLVRIFEIQSGELLLELEGHSSAVFALSFAPDAARLASAGANGELILWDARSGAQLSRTRPHRGAIWAMDWCANGESIATAGADETVRVLDAATLEQRAVLRGHRDGVRSVALAPDGRRVVSGGWDRTVRVWDAASGNESLTLRGHAKRVDSVAFSADGRRIASGSLDATLRIWESGDHPLSSGDQ